MNEFDGRTCLIDPVPKACEDLFVFQEAAEQTRSGGMGAGHDALSPWRVPYPADSGL